MTPKSITRINYAKARSRIRDADVLLFRGTGTLSAGAIEVAGRSPYSHAAMAAWWGDDLFCLETLQFIGGRAVSLSGRVNRYGGEIDVYRPQTQLLVSGKTRHVREEHIEVIRQRIVHHMRRICGKPYGWGSLVATGLTHLPVLRFFWPPSTDDRLNGSLPFCSQAVAWAARFGWMDLVPNLADGFTEPGDLARASLLKYLFTLARPAGGES